MAIVASNSLTLSNVNDGTITHYAYAYSADGTDGFTTVYPNLNLLDGTKDFSGDWVSWGFNDGTYKGLTVKKRTSLWAGIYKKCTVSTNSDYTFSAFVKGYGAGTNIVRTVFVNGAEMISMKKTWTSAFDWERDSITILAKDIKLGYEIFVRYEISVLGTNSAVWTAGHKWEPGSIATPYMPSSSEATTADYPSYIGQYTDFTQANSTNPSAYTWSLIRGNDGKDGKDGKDGTNGTDGNPGKIVSDTEPTTRFKGLTWKYSGTADLTASDGTVIKPNIEYYYNGTKWLINLIEANQLNVNELAAISAYLGHVYAAIVEDNQSDGSGFLLNSEKQLLRVNKTANTYNQIFSEGLTTFAKISDLPGIGNIIPGANYISAILAGNFIQFGQYSTAVNSNGVPVGGTPVGLGTISFGQTSANSYGFTLTGDLTVAGNIKSLKDTDWIDIPPASGWGGTMRYMIAEGKFYLRLTNVTNPAVSATTARTMCTIPTTAVPLGGIRGIPILSYGEPIAELVINANGTVQFYPHNAVGTGQSLHVFVQGIPLA